MSEKLLYFLNVGVSKVGRIDADEEQSIVIGGLGIVKEHCVISRTQLKKSAPVDSAVDDPNRQSDTTSSEACCDSVTIRALQGARVYVNAKLVNEGEEAELRHCDRLVLGNANVFRVRSVLVSVPEFLCRV